MFERIKPPAVLEVDSVENTDRGNKGFGSIGVKTTSESINSVTKNSPMSESIFKLSTNDAIQNSR